MNAASWPRGVSDPFCAQDHLIGTPTDRRPLWHIEGQLAVLGTSDMLRQLGRYLDATCDHHMHEYTSDPENENDFPAHRQCLWCNHVEWQAPADGGTE